MEEKSQLKQPSMNNAMMSLCGTKYTRNHPQQITLSKMVTNDLTIDLALPFSTVDPKFVVPCGSYSCRDVLPKMVGNVESELKRISNSSRFLSMTLDLRIDRRMQCFMESLFILLVNVYLNLIFWYLDVSLVRSL